MAAQIVVKAPESAYLAVVAEDRAWNDPSYESVAAAGSVTWVLPAGTYRIVAGAPGYATQFSDSIALAASEMRELRFPLTPLAAVKGFVVDEAGYPIANASITSAGPRHALTAMGEAHLRGNAVAISGANGAFTASVAPQAQKVIVEATEYAPRAVEISRLADKPSSTVVLQKGASLGLRWSAEVTPRSEKISLLPVDAEIPAGLTRAEAIALWTRSITASAPRWDALPAGTWQIVLRSVDAASAPPPLDLGEVVLAPDDQRTVNVALPPPATKDVVGTIRVLVEAGEGLTITHWRGSSRAKIVPSVKSVSGGSLLTFAAPCSAGSTLLFESPEGLGSATLDGACKESIRVQIAPRAGIAARITVPAGMRSPQTGTLRIDGATEIPFAIIDSRINAAVPANNHQLTMHVNGFAPVTLATQRLKAGETANVGTIALREGAAAALRVRSAATADLMAGVRITAIRAHDLPAIRRDAELESFALATAVSDASGWARLSGLPDEQIVFFLRAAGRKYAQVSEPWALTPGTETVIDDLRLQAASNVYVTVARPEELEHSLELSIVELFPTGHNHWPRFLPISGAITPSGTVIEDVPPGSWEVQATGRLKNGFAIRAAKTTVDVVSGVDRHVALNISDRLYQGRVTRGGSPVSGSINLKPANRRAGRRTAVAKIAGDGTFQVLLEGDGEYSVRIQESSGNGVSLNRYVAFTKPEDEVAVELPARRIAGRVIDSTGMPVSGVMVSANQQLAEPAGGASTVNLADGRFVIESVGPGTWEVVASTKNGQSESVVVSVDTADVDDVTLLLEPVQIIKVRLTDMTGAPVRQAFIAAEYSQPGVMHLKSDVRSTNSDGTAEFRLLRAQQTTPLNLVLATFDVRISCALRRLDSDQNITLPPTFGELRLVGRELRNRGSTESWLLSSTGCAVPFLGTHSERDSSGASATVFPKLAAGTWSYVEIRTPEELASLLTGRAASLSTVRTFKVESGKVTRVELPAR